MTIETDILRQLENLNKGFGQMADSMRQMALASGARVDGRTAIRGEVAKRKGASSHEHTEKQAENLDVAASKLYKIKGNLTKDIKATRSAFNDMRDAWSKSSGALVGFEEEFNIFGESIGVVAGQAMRIAQGMGRFSHQLAKTTKAQSLLYSQQINNLTKLKDYEKAGAFDSLTNALEGLDESSKKAFNLIDKVTGKMRTDLDLEDFSKIRSAMGEVLAGIQENIGQTDFSSIQEMLAAGDKAFISTGIDDKGSDNRAALVKIAAELEARPGGLYTPASPDLSVLKEVIHEDGRKTKELKNPEELAQLFSTAHFKDFSEGIAKLAAKLDKGAKDVDVIVDNFNIPFRKFGAMLNSVEGRMAAMREGFNYFLTTAALYKAADGFKQLYKELNAFNIAQIPASYVDVNLAAVQLGLNFQETTAILADNKRTLASYGPKAFGGLLGELKTTFARAGYSMAQAAELIGPTTEAAIASGINIRDPGELNSFTDRMMKSFNEISGIINISAKEFIQLNTALYKSEGVFETMLGLEVQRRDAYGAELIQARKRYILDGLSAQQAQKLLELHASQTRDSVKTKVDDAGKLLSAAQLAGMSGQEQMKIFNLTLKERTTEESTEYDELLGKLGQGREQKRQGEIARTGGYSLLNDSWRDNIGLDGKVAEIIKTAGTKIMAKDARATNTEKEAKDAGDAGKGSTTMSIFSNWINSASTIIQSVLIGAVTGTAISMLALRAQTVGLDRAFGTLMTKIAGMGLPGTPGPIIGTQNPGPKSGKGGLRGRIDGLSGGMKGGLAVGGMVLTGAAAIGGDALTTAGHEKSGAALGILGQAGSMAMTGAMLGSLVGPAGTAIGAAVGGALGVGMGVYQNRDTLFDPSIPEPPKPEQPKQIKKPEVTVLPKVEKKPEATVLPKVEKKPAPKLESSSLMDKLGSVLKAIPVIGVAATGYETSKETSMMDKLGSVLKAIPVIGVAAMGYETATSKLGGMLTALHPVLNVAAMGYEGITSSASGAGVNSAAVPTDRFKEQLIPPVAMPTPDHAKKLSLKEGDELTGINKGSGTGLIGVSDVKAGEGLGLIASQQLQMIQLLQKLYEKQGGVFDLPEIPILPTQSPQQFVPSGYMFTTGRK